jgi:PAS domain S-box-containing protein
VARERAAHVAVMYAVFAVVWIALSDGVLAWFGLSAEMITRYSFIKGLAFVLVTGFALYLLVSRFAFQDAEHDRMYRELFDENPNPMWFYDLETLAFLKVNDAAVRKYGYSREAFLKMTIADIRPSEDYDRLMANIEATRGGVPGKVDQAGVWRHRTKDGTVLWVDITSHLTTVDGRSAEVVLVRDVTEAREAREELLRYQADLERLVSERTAQLERANVELKAATDAKSAFLATMSHELRTPLNSILGFSKILADGKAGPLNDEQQRQMGFLRTSAEHLHALIGDVLDISRIESGRMEIHLADVSLAEIVGALDGTVGALATAKGLAWRLAPVPDAVMRTDARKVLQILLNLLGNAVKYTETGTVGLTVVAGPRQVTFDVSDTGPGIAEEQRERVFEDFVRAEAETSAAEGSGLGLAIAVRLARLLGGTLELTAASSEGSTFRLTLPSVSTDPEGADAHS